MSAAVEGRIPFRGHDDGIAGSELVILDGCSHMAHVEQPERYLTLLDGFFSRVERTG